MHPSVNFIGFPNIQNMSFKIIPNSRPLHSGKAAHPCYPPPLSPTYQTYHLLHSSAARDDIQVMMPENCMCWSGVITVKWKLPSRFPLRVGGLGGRGADSRDATGITCRDIGRPSRSKVDPIESLPADCGEAASTSRPCWANGGETCTSERNGVIGVGGGEGAGDSNSYGQDSDSVSTSTISISTSDPASFVRSMH